MNGTLTLSTWDWVIVICGVLAASVAGLRAVRQSRDRTDDAVDYILAGRTLTTPLFVASLIATWYGSVLGAGEFIARHGIVMLLCFGLPYYVVAILYAVVLSKYIRRSSAVSISDQMRITYGETAGRLAAMLMLVIAIPAPFMLSLGLVIQSVTGAPLFVSVACGAAVSLYIVAKGGLRSDVHANVVQVVLMYVGFAALLGWCIASFGSPLTLWPAMPMRLTEVPGSLGWTGIAVWFLIALQTFIDPNFHVRAAAARTSDVARRGLLWSVVGWMIFDAIQLLIGLYAVTYASVSDPSVLLMSVAEITLPSVWKGLFLTGVLAAIISTLDGYALSSATIIGHDLIDRWRGGGHRRSSLWIGLVVTGIIGVIASIAIPSVVDLIFYAATIAVPTLFLPLIVALKRSHLHAEHSASTPSSVLLWMVIPGMAALTLIILRANGIEIMEPMLGGLVISFAFLPRILRRYGRSAN